MIEKLTMSDMSLENILTKLNEVIQILNDLTSNCPPHVHSNDGPKGGLDGYF